MTRRLPKTWTKHISASGRRLWLKHVIGRSAGTLLLLSGTDLAWGAQVLAVRVWPAPDYTRITLESDVALKAQQQVLRHPTRLVIDIEGLDLNPSLRDLVAKIKPDDPYIAKLRVGQLESHKVRLVVDLKQEVQPQLFSLEPVAAYQHRLVFDLYPSQPADPLLALLQEHEQASPPSAPTGAEQRSGLAAKSLNDALGEFVAKLPAPPSSSSAASTPTSPPDSAAALASKEPATSAVGKQKRLAGKGVGPMPDWGRLIIIALDPGHGGEDPGAIGPAGTYEKHIALSVARKLKDRLETQSNVRILMTRDSDFFVPLHERVVKARQVQADLFVSIHADAFTTPAAHGASVFALSEHGASSATARWMAQRENSSDVVGGINVKTKDQYVLRTLLDMSITTQIKSSMLLGSEVLRRIGSVGSLHSGAVEQAAFAVLKAPDIPSILVETGFISNPQEEEKLKDEAYQNELADALYVGIMHYFAKQPPSLRRRA